MAAVSAILVRCVLTLVGLTLTLLSRRAATAVTARLRAGIGAMAGAVVAPSGVIGHMALLLFATIVVIT